MKRTATYIFTILGLWACNRVEIDEVTSSDAFLLEAQVNPVCMIQGDFVEEESGVPMTRALIGKETTQSLLANFIKVDEVFPEGWTSGSQYDMDQTSMPSLEFAQIVEADIYSSASSVDGKHLRAATFNPTLFYKYVPKAGSVEPELAHRIGMVGWYPMTYDVPEGLGEEDALAQFSSSGSMKMVDGDVCVEFKNKLDGQTDLMVTDYREGRIQMDGFKHNTTGTDWDIQPFSHSNTDPLKPESFEYINYFTFHHYLSAIRIFIKATPEDRGKAIWTRIDNILVMNQPKTAVIQLPTHQARGEGTAIVEGTTPTLPSEDVTPSFGEVKSWDDYDNFDIVRTPMFVNHGPDETYRQPASLPYTLPTTGQIEPEYLGYALVKPDQVKDDGVVTQIKIYTDAGTFLVDLPEIDDDNHLLQPGRIYDYIINVNSVGGVDVVVRNEDDDKYQALAPYNEQYQGYEYSNCYVINKAMIRDGVVNHYSGFFFRAYVPGRGTKGDVAGDPYPSDYKLEPKYVKLYAQTYLKPIDHVELIQGYVRFSLDDNNHIENGEVVMSPGNAIIAAYDDNDNIIWTWHIWVVDELKEVKAGDVTMLDRNVGARWAPSSAGDLSSATPEQRLASYGLYYQWGRKDPSPGPLSYDYDIIDMRTYDYYTMDGVRTDVAEVYMIGEAPTIQDAVRNPLVILSPSDVSPVYSNDWLWTKNDDLWGNVSGKKTIYDPCPYGYKVPDHELKTLFENNQVNFTYGTYGASYSGSNGYVFFPYAGWKGDDVKRVSRTHAWMKVGEAGDYQNATYDPNTFHRGRSLLAKSAFNVVIYGNTKNTYVQGHNYGYTNRTAAASVRCVKYDGEPLRAGDLTVDRSLTTP